MSETRSWPGVSMVSLAGPHNWLIFAMIEPALERVLARHGKGRLLDIGCGSKPYAELARPYVSEHVGLDHEATRHDRRNVDLFGSAYRIPAESGSYDTVLCTDVLEHLEEPARALAEARRVLAPGGCAIYTVPLFWHLHEEPRDFYRYTKHGLRHLFEGAGFEVLEILPLCGFLATFAQELCYWVWRRAPKRAWHPGYWLARVLVAVAQHAAYRLDRFDRSPEFTAEYLVVARTAEEIQAWSRRAA